MVKFPGILTILLLTAFVSVSGQRLLNISVRTDGNTSYLPFTERNGMYYVSSKGLAEALGGTHYYSDKTGKLELKFDEFKLKVTGRNQYVNIIPREGGKAATYQLPVSTLLLKGDVFIPLEYSLEYVSQAYGRKLKFDEGNREITAGGDVDEKPMVYNISHTPQMKDKVEIPEKPGDFPEIIKIDGTNSAYDIRGISIEEKVNGTQIRVKAGRQIGKPLTYIQNNICFLFLTGVTVAPEITSNAIPAGLVKSVRRNNVDNNVQLEFDLKANHTGYDSFQDPATNDIIITIRNDRLAADEKPKELPQKDKWKFDVVVIDAGHGGKDPGAIGITGVKEKDVNLGISLKLGKLIEKNMPGVKVVYTRDTDEFIELYKRGKIANEADGKLFISVHCNSLGKKNKSVRGFEVYLLRPGRTKEAIEIAEMENSVIRYEDNPDKYEELTDENFILVSMAHSSFMRYSEQFSDVLNRHWLRETKIPSRGIKQAGFYVLVGASMPGVLVETGFLSNREDERYLSSSKGQQAIAASLFESVKEYKDYYENSLALND